MGTPGVVAAVVAYQSDERLLRACVEAVAPQVDHVLVVDNGSGPARGALEQLAAAGDVVLVTNAENRGVAGALNQVLDHAAGVGAAWVLLLDQDTEVAPDLVDVLGADVPDDVAVVCPRVVDRDLGEQTEAASGAPEREVDFCITSGALYRVSACRAVGGYDEQLFIDFVDFDLCLRLRLAGHRLLQRGAAVTQHSIGRSRRHGRWIAYNHSPQRCYFIARDTMRYAYKHRRAPKALKVGERGVVHTVLHLAKKAAVVVAFEDRKLAKATALVRGVVVATARAARPDPSRGAARA